MCVRNVVRRDAYNFNVPRHISRENWFDLDLLTFRPRGVYGKFHHFVRTFQKAVLFVLLTLTFLPFYLAVFLQTRGETGDM